MKKNESKVYFCSRRIDTNKVYKENKHFSFNERISSKGGTKKKAYFMNVALQIDVKQL